MKGSVWVVAVMAAGCAAVCVVSQAAAEPNLATARNEALAAGVDQPAGNKPVSVLNGAAGAERAVAPATASVAEPVAAATAVEAAEPAKPAPPPKPALTLQIRIDLSTQRMSVEENGVAKHSFAISSGREGYATPTGTFKPQWMSKMWYSKKYDNAPMPHAVFFSGGVAMHGTSSVGMLGRPASHGCIRLAPANAATVFKLVQRHGMGATKISVFGSPPSRAVASKRQSPSSRAVVASAGQQRVVARRAPSGQIVYVRYPAGASYGPAGYYAPSGYRPVMRQANGSMVRVR